MRVESRAVPTSLAPDDSRTDRDRMKAAGEEFEAIIVAQMLRSARQEGSMGSLGAESGGSDDTITEFAEQQLSKALASAGGLGLAKLVIGGLGQAVAKHSAVQR